MPKYKKGKYTPPQLLKYLSFWLKKKSQLILLDIIWYYNLVNGIFKININKYCIYIYFKIACFCNELVSLLLDFALFSFFHAVSPLTKGSSGATGYYAKGTTHSPPTWWMIEKKNL